MILTAFLPRLALVAALGCSGTRTDEPPEDGIERLAVASDLPDPGTRLGWTLASAAADLERGRPAPTALVVNEQGMMRLRFVRGTPEEALQRARDVVAGQFPDAEVVLVHPAQAQLGGGKSEVWIADVRGRSETWRVAIPFRRTPLGVALDGAPRDLPPGEGSGLFRPVQPGNALPPDDPLAALIDVGWNALPPEEVPRPPAPALHRSKLGVALPDAWSATGWALAHGLWTASDGEPAATFAVVVGPDGPAYLRYTGEEPFAAQARARKQLAEEFALWPSILVSQTRLDLGFGKVDTLVAEVYRPGTKMRAIALPWRAGEAGRPPALASLPVFVGGWPSASRDPVVGVTDPVGPAADAELFERFRSGWQLHPYGRRFWSGDVP